MKKLRSSLLLTLCLSLTSGVAPVQAQRSSLLRFSTKLLIGTVLLWHCTETEGNGHASYGALGANDDLNVGEYSSVESLKVSSRLLLTEPPTSSPSMEPTGTPSSSPTISTGVPTNAPSVNTNAPSINTNNPTANTNAPSVNTNNPTANTNAPSINTNSPTANTNAPSVNTNNPTANTNAPSVNTNNPSKTPTKVPTNNPSTAPTNNPSTSPTEVPTSNPTKKPTKNPSTLTDNGASDVDGRDGGDTQESGNNNNNNNDDSKKYFLGENKVEQAFAITSIAVGSFIVLSLCLYLSSYLYICNLNNESQCCRSIRKGLKCILCCGCITNLSCYQECCKKCCCQNDLFGRDTNMIGNVLDDDNNNADAEL